MALQASGVMPAWVFADSRIGGGCSPLKGADPGSWPATNDSLIARGVRCVAMEPFDSVFVR